MTTITVPAAAAHLLVTPQPCDCDEDADELTETGHYSPHPMVLRFLPTDATVECVRCGGSGAYVENSVPGFPGIGNCPICIDTPGRRPLRAGDRIAIRADNNLNVGNGLWTVARAADGRWGAMRGPKWLHIRPGEDDDRATVARVLEIHSATSMRPEQAIRVDHCYPLTLIEGNYDPKVSDISAHLDAGLSFRPGGVALDLNVETANITRSRKVE